MGMYVQNTPKCLRHGDDPGTGFWVPGGFAQQLVDGLIRKANEISEQLASVHEIRTEHFWNGESPQAMADVFQKLILQSRKRATTVSTKPLQKPNLFWKRSSQTALTSS